MLNELKIGVTSGSSDKTDESLWEWVFFPLYKLENLPPVGFMFEIPLDMVALLLDNSDILLEGLTPLLFKGLDIATDVGSAVPVPGVNTVIASASLGLTLFQEPTRVVYSRWIRCYWFIYEYSKKTVGIGIHKCYGSNT